MKTHPALSIIVPARNEELRIAETLAAVRSASQQWNGLSSIPELELIVVDDGSSDMTYRRAAHWADVVVRHPTCCGKGKALSTGKHAARGNVLVFLDADLGASARFYPELALPVLNGLADMVIAQLAGAARPGGLGLVKKLAKQGVYGLSGFSASAPLSGQRAVRREVLERIGRLSGGFGVEVGLTIDAVKLGYRVLEQPVPFAHRETGRDLHSWLHRGKQLCAVGGTLWRWWRQPVC
ncbi:glycosyltransferase family 2 protein [Paenibacillus xerothermodurans]|uniref:Glucosyl-3-phosphoglycerate synthase n=1 Tax=Paenibacillus xerothermodurans TaxID=1977292 RepID=A0A2W1NG33_PAEXE|nr:glycosyltransferase family 2 protein [Paenibacillus xerothermodurans]PZE22031.1 glycosyltransferase family 2 protein [Paenibacillus xerothermodurans]